MANENAVMMEGVTIIFRNFAGKESEFNRAGARNFGVLIDEATATRLTEAGWNVKWLQPRDEEEGETPQAWLPVEVGYKIRPPRIVQITSRGRTNLGEEEVEVLDWADIVNVDLIVNPYHWSVGGKSGVKAYLQSMFVTIEEDPLERKYAERTSG